MLQEVHNYWRWRDDFIGGGTFGTSASEGDPWVVTDTSAAGAPTYDRQDHGSTGGAPGVARLILQATSEVQNVCLSFGDKLCWDIDLLRSIEFRVQMAQAALDAATQVAFGLTGDRNDAIDSIAQAALFRLIGGTSTTAVVVESDDGTNDNDDKATGITLINSWKRFVIDFSGGKSNVKFYGGDANGSLKRLASSTTFDMSNYSGALQPFFQIQKTADTNADGIHIDYVEACGVRE